MLYGGGGIPFQLKSDSLPHTHAQTTKTYYEHQDLRIKKAQDSKTKTSANSDIQDLPLRYQVYQGRLLASFQDDEKYEHVETLGRLDLYLDHLDMDLLKYLSQVITTEMHTCVSKIIDPPKKGWVFLASTKKDKGKEKFNQNETNGVEARSSTTDKGKENVSQDETGGAEARTSTVDSDYDKLIGLRNRIKTNREAKAKPKGNPVLEMNEPNDENSMLVDNVRGETFEEHDIYMNELLTRLKTTDEDGKLKILSFLLKNMWTSIQCMMKLHTGD
ncbi:hypothetical protein Tco_1279856 [Tanacetum coccineum]